MPFGFGFGWSPTIGLGGAGDPIQAVFADGTDGFYFDFSKTDRLFQEVTGITPADGAGENIGLALDCHSWGGRTYAQELAQQPELVSNGDFATGDLTGWTDGDSGTGDSTYVAGAMRLVGTDGSNRGMRGQGITDLTIGRTYAVSWTGATASGLATLGVGDVNVPNISNARFAALVAAGGSGVFVATATTHYLKIITASGGGDVTVDNLSVKLVPGNHGLQATAAAQPKWQTGGLARFDGSDDNLLTTLVPGTAMTLLFKGVIPAASASLKVFLGAQESSTGRCHLYMNTSGNLACAAGDNSFNSAISIASSTCVIGAIFSGGQAYYCHNGSVTAAGAYTGDPTALRQLAIGARNVNGTPDLFSNPDAARALAIKKALTAAEIAAITNLWGTS